MDPITPERICTALGVPAPPRATVTLELMDDAAALVTTWRNASGAHVTPSQSGQLRAMVAGALADAQVAGWAAALELQA